jgi:SAM-dependent methyltransferase
MTVSGYTPQGLVPRTRAAIAGRGLRPVIGDYARFAGDAAAGLPRIVLGSNRRFLLWGREYSYLEHPYKLSWLSERTVEVPVAQAFVDRHPPDHVLEVGNVLSHYRPQQHTIVDKYERADGVLNRDVIDLSDLGHFDLIVAVSTLEHVGLDEQPPDPNKPLQAAHALRAMLAPGGKLLITLPAGYNRDFDAVVRSGALAVGDSAGLRRVPGRNEWRKAEPDDVFSAPYDFLLYRARGVLFALIDAIVE